MAKRILYGEKSPSLIQPLWGKSPPPSSNPCGRPCNTECTCDVNTQIYLYKETIMDDKYEKLRNFLVKRDISHMLNAFVLQKIDDDVARHITDEQLESMGMLLGDIMAYRYEI